jgi:Xaa-Pro aminopeptidase
MARSKSPRPESPSAIRHHTGLSVDLVKAVRVRQSRLRRLFDQQGLDGLLVSNPKDTRYLSGFNSKDCLLLVFRDGAAVISDVRDEAALQVLDGTGIADIVIGTQHRLPVTINDQARRRGIRRLGIQADHLTLAAKSGLAEHLGEDALVETSGVIGGLRMRKDATELALIEKAIAIHEAALTAALTQLRVGMSELQFCAVLEYEMRRRGSEGTSFSTMVASGQRSHMIHYATSALPIRPGVLLVDMGALYEGYCSDMTRTFGFGMMPPKITEIFGIVREAQRAAMAAIRPGRTCAEIDAAARDLITRAGYGEQFSHGLGHGIGLDIHEAPRFNQLQTDIVLEPGMVLTVEPGIYLPGVGGVRIEDDIVVTDDGCRVLTSFPRELDEVMLDLVAAPSKGKSNAAGRGAGARKTGRGLSRRRTGKSGGVSRRAGPSSRRRGATRAGRASRRRTRA